MVIDEVIDENRRTATDHDENRRKSSKLDEIPLPSMEIYFKENRITSTKIDEQRW